MAAGVSLATIPAPRPECDDAIYATVFSLPVHPKSGFFSPSSRIGFVAEKENEYVNQNVAEITILPCVRGVSARQKAQTSDPSQSI